MLFSIFRTQSRHIFQARSCIPHRVYLNRFLAVQNVRMFLSSYKLQDLQLKVAMAEDELGEDDPKLGQLYYELGKAYITEEKYDQAISNLEITLKFLNPSNSPSSVLCELNSLLGKCYENVNDYTNAIDFYSKAIGYHPEGELRFSESNIMDYCTLSQLYCQIGDLQQAYNTLSSILPHINSYPNKHCGIGVYFTRLSSASRQIGKLPEAINHVQTAVQILKSPELSRPDLLNDAKAELAMNKSAEGNYEEAERLMKQVIDERLKYYKEDINLLRYKNSLAMIQQATQNLQLAIATYKDAIETCKRLDLTNSFLGYTLYNNLAASLSESGNFNEALGGYLSASNIISHIYGEISDQSASNLTQMATVYTKLQQYPQAIQHAEKAIEIRQKVNSDNIKVGRSYLFAGELHHLYGDSSKALKYLEEGITIFKPLIDTPEVLHDELLPSSMGHLAMIYLTQGRNPEAENLMQEALNLKKRVFGTENHPSISESYLEFGIYYQKNKLYSQSLDCLNRAYSIAKNTVGTECPLAVDILDVKALGLIGEGKYDEGIQMYNEILRIKTKVYGKDSAEVGKCYHKISHAYYQKGDYDSAIRMYGQGTDMCERFNPRDPKLSKYYENLADLYNCKGNREKEEECVKKAIQAAKKNGQPLDKLQERISARNE